MSYITLSLKSILLKLPSGSYFNFVPSTFRGAEWKTGRLGMCFLVETVLLSGEIDTTRFFGRDASAIDAWLTLQSTILGTGKDER